MDEELKKLTAKLEEEITWIIDEITILKKISINSRIPEKELEVISKYLIPAFYALWEGYVVKSFKIYINQLNEMNLPLEKIHLKLIAHDLDMKKNLKEPRINFNKQLKFTNEIIEYFNETTKISDKIPTSSNVNLKVINEILDRFNLEKLDEKLYKSRLDKLVHWRNAIAHGEKFLVSKEMIEESSKICIDCIYELTEKIEEGLKNKKFLKPKTNY